MVSPISFEHPTLLWFLVGVPLLVVAYFYNIKFKKREALRFSNFEAISRVFEPQVIPSYFLQLIIQVLIFLSLVLSAAGVGLWYSAAGADVNFALVIDASSSMTATDIEPSRIQVARETGASFIDSLPFTAKIAVLSFSGTTVVDQELTDDFVKARNKALNIKLKALGGTDIGGAIVTAANIILVGDNAKVIVLITDGRSTVGLPISDAIGYTQDRHMVVNTIGIGTDEGAGFFGEEDPLARTTLDEESLQLISNSTNGKYYKAGSKLELIQAYEDIRSTTVKTARLDLSPYLLSIVIMLLILHWILAFTKYSSIP